MLEHPWDKCIKLKAHSVKKYIFCFFEFLKVGQGWRSPLVCSSSVGFCNSIPEWGFR
jgi:hypothetical protein